MVTRLSLTIGHAYLWRREAVSVWTARQCALDDSTSIFFLRVFGSVSLEAGVIGKKWCVFLFRALPDSHTLTYRGRTTAP